MNCYATLGMIKSDLSIASATTTYDTRLFDVLEVASRTVDTWCHRKFFGELATRYFPGSGSPLFLDDLLSITASSFKLDEDGNGTFEVTLATTDYILCPLNGFPKTYVKVAPDGDYGGFAAGQPKGVEIAGLWGYGSETDATPYRLSTTTLNGDHNASTTSIAVVSGTPFSAGHTILIDSEQMDLTAVSSNTLTVVRGINSTTAATHSTGATVYIWEYPRPIIQATLIIAQRIWKGKDGSYFGPSGAVEIGQAVEQVAWREVHRWLPGIDSYIRKRLA